MVRCKLVAQVKNSSVQRFVRYRVNGVWTFCIFDVLSLPSLSFFLKLPFSDDRLLFAVLLSSAEFFVFV